MKIILLTILFICSVAQNSYAQFRINIKFDASRSLVKDASMKFEWTAKELEFDRKFKKNKLFLSGLAGGARREGSNLAEGNFLHIRVYRTISVKKFEINPSFGIIYGHPGLRSERTKFDANGGYVHVNLVRNVDLPSYNVKKPAVAYPEISLSLRKKVWRLSAEPVVSMRIMRYGILKSNFGSGNYKVVTVISPSVGFRFGFRF